MASRKEQKDAARERRLAEERAAKAKAQRTRRMQILGGVVVAAIVVVVVLVIVSTNSGNKNSTVKINSKKATTTAATVNKSLAGIPQSGNTLGNPKAKVTMTEFGDLECPICKEFAVGPETQLIAHEVKQGKVKLVYKSYPTATDDLSDAATIFPLQQSAAYAAGAQHKAWNYILLFYHEQGSEDTPYVNTSYLTTLAKQVPGLNVAKWSSDYRSNPALENQIISDENQAKQLGITGTPGIMFSSAHKQTKLVSGYVSYSGLQSMIKSVA